MLYELRGCAVPQTPSGVQFSSVAVPVLFEVVLVVFVELPLLVLIPLVVSGLVPALSLFLWNPGMPSSSPISSVPDLLSSSVSGRTLPVFPIHPAVNSAAATNNSGTNAFHFMKFTSFFKKANDTIFGEPTKAKTNLQIILGSKIFKPFIL